MDSSVVSLIIMGLVVLLFIIDILPSGTVAMMGCVAMIALKVATVPQVLSGFSGEIILILFGMQIIGLALFSSGAAQMIGGIAVKISADNERRYIFVSCLIAAVLSAFLSNTAVVAMMIAIAGSIARISTNIKLKNLVLPVAIATIFGGASTLVGSTPQLVASGLLEDMGVQGFGLLSLSYLGVPLIIVMLIYVTTIGYSKGKKIWGNRPEIEEEIKTETPELEKKSNNVNQNKSKAYIVIGIFILVLIMFIIKIVSIGTSAMIGGLLCIITGAITQKEVFAKMNWNVVIWLCCTLGLGSALNSSGGGQLIADTFLKIFGVDASPQVFFASIILLVLIMSNVMANTTSIVVFLPPALFLANAMGVNPYTFAYGITFAAGLTFALPLANGFVGLSMSAGYKFTDLAKYGWLLSIIVYLIVVIFTPMIFPF